MGQPPSLCPWADTCRGWSSQGAYSPGSCSSETSVPKACSPLRHRCAATHLMPRWLGPAAGPALLLPAVPMLQSMPSSMVLPAVVAAQQGVAAAPCYTCCTMLHPAAHNVPAEAPFDSMCHAVIRPDGTDQRCMLPTGSTLVTTATCMSGCRAQAQHGTAQHMPRQQPAVPFCLAGRTKQPCDACPDCPPPTHTHTCELHLAQPLESGSPCEGREVPRLRGHQRQAGSRHEPEHRVRAQVLQQARHEAPGGPMRGWRGLGAGGDTR
jgi:hypothetical protein